VLEQSSFEEILDPSPQGQTTHRGSATGAARRGRLGLLRRPGLRRPFGHAHLPAWRQTGQALRRCPQTIVLPPRHKAYREYSARMMTILSEYSPLIEPLSMVVTRRYGGLCERFSS
jgi:DNA polymerase-4